MADEAIEQEALDWVARLDWEGRDPDVEAALERWLELDRRHQGAFLRAQAAWSSMDRTRAVADGSARRPTATRRMILGGGIAAAAVAAGIAGYVVLQPRPVFYETGSGELRRIRLEDGSVAALNADSVISVTMAKAQRRVRVEKGDVWFQVAKDRARPFVVGTDRLEVTAVGTEFAVRSSDRGAEVMVNEGIVDIHSTNAPSVVRRLPAGLSAAVQGDGRLTLMAMSLDAMARALAWRDGQVGLDGETLREAVQIFNRYNTTKLVIVDPVVAERKLVGWFRIDDPEGFARIAALALDVRIEVQSGQIVLEDPTRRGPRDRFVSR